MTVDPGAFEFLKTALYGLHTADRQVFFAFPEETFEFLIVKGIDLFK
jgi:hypothetical protein